ncbi:hypothetical protein ACLOJK_003090 [Asimina triloba]
MELGGRSFPLDQALPSHVPLSFSLSASPSLPLDPMAIGVPPPSRSYRPPCVSHRRPTALPLPSSPAKSPGFFSLDLPPARHLRSTQPTPSISGEIHSSSTVGFDLTHELVEEMLQRLRKRLPSDSSHEGDSVPVEILLTMLTKIW